MYTIRFTFIALSLGAAAVVLPAQTTSTDANGPRGPHRGGPHGPGGHGGPARGGHGISIVRALDADKNHELSSTELANAAASIRTLDANTDGVVSNEELRPMRHPGAPMHHARKREHPAAAPERKLGAPDGPAELPDGTPAPERKGWKKMHRGEGVAHPRPVDPIMLALDANNDGSLSETEVANATASLTALDGNNDGKLTFDELRPLPPEN
jgi:hypothetical protein